MQIGQTVSLKQLLSQNIAISHGRVGFKIKPTGITHDAKAALFIMHTRGSYVVIINGRYYNFA
jgi:hypothetical protein